MKISKNLKTLEQVLLFGFFLLFPLVFFPGFINIFPTAKILLLAVIAALFLLSKAARIIIERKIILSGSNLDTPLFLLIVSYLLSLIIASPNKVEALVDPTRGALLISLFVIMILAAPKNKEAVLKATLIGMLVNLVVSIGSYFSVFKFLPQTLQFINNKGFSLWGDFVNQAVYAGFFLAFSFNLLREQENKQAANDSATPLVGVKNPLAINSGLLNLLFVASLLTFVTSLYVLFKDIKPQFLPLSTSWQISVDTLKDSRSALFGVGPANYNALYTRSKPITINNSPHLWNANVEYSGSAVLHIFTEAGLLGFFALVLIIWQLYSLGKKQKLTLPIIFLLGAGLLLPLNQAFWFLIFTAVYLLKEEKEPRKFDLKELDIFAYATGLIISILVIIGGFFYYRVIFSEYLLRQAVYAAQNNQAQKVYELQNKAIVNNPYSPVARNHFIQTNLILANSLASKKKPTETDQQQYTALIQQAITNARDIVTLNPQQAAPWANLAEVYRYLIRLQVKEADVWTITSYQRAIAADPNNPLYRFSLGAVYYGLGNYDEAVRFFEQAIGLKSDVANYYYNLAYAHYQRQDFVKAVNAMEAALQYVEKGTDDYKKAKKELAEFKTKLPKTEEGIAEEELNPETLSEPEVLPTGKPEIELPKESAPPEK